MLWRAWVGRCKQEQSKYGSVFLINSDRVGDEGPQPALHRNELGFSLHGKSLINVWWIYVYCYICYELVSSYQSQWLVIIAGLRTNNGAIMIFWLLEMQKVCYMEIQRSFLVLFTWLYFYVHKYQTPERSVRSVYLSIFLIFVVFKSNPKCPKILHLFSPFSFLLVLVVC